MNDIATPSALARMLTELFPEFPGSLDDESLTSWHQVVQALTPVINGYLQGAPPKTIERFCAVVNAMVAAGGEQENAISTCLLEHASQIRVRNIIRPHLSAAARKELR